MPIKLGDPFSFDQTLPERGIGEVGGEERTRVAIVGAGLAGLTCAHRLAASTARHVTRADVVVLERERQPGGRVRGLQVGDTVVNLGAVSIAPEHYQHYMALLAELGLADRVRMIPRRRMLFGANGRATRADNVSLVVDMLKGLAGRGVFSPPESAQLLRFYFFMRRVTAPDNEAEFMALHELSVTEWARGFGFGDSLQRKFVRPLTHYCFRPPEEVSAAFGVILLGSNLTGVASLDGGFSQVVDAIAQRLGDMLETEARVVEIEREPGGFVLIYESKGALCRLRAQRLVVAIPANVAAQLMPEMRAQASRVKYGSGRGMVLRGALKQKYDLQLRSADGLIYGGEAQAAPDGTHVVNVLTYSGENSLERASKLFRDGLCERIVEYDIQPASAAPMAGQQPLPVEWGDGLFLAGDCAGLFPSQETAVATGEEAARLLLEQN